MPRIASRPELLVKPAFSDGTQALQVPDGPLKTQTLPNMRAGSSSQAKAPAGNSLWLIFLLWKCFVFLSTISVFFLLLWVFLFVWVGFFVFFSFSLFPDAVPLSREGSKNCISSQALWRCSQEFNTVLATSLYESLQVLRFSLGAVVSFGTRGLPCSKKLCCCLCGRLSVGRFLGRHWSKGKIFCNLSCFVRCVGKVLMVQQMQLIIWNSSPLTWMCWSRLFLYMYSVICFLGFRSFSCAVLSRTLKIGTSTLDIRFSRD